MKRVELLKTPPCEAPEDKESDLVLAVSQIIELDGKETLNLDLFHKGELKGRYFADKEENNACSFVDGKWYYCRIDNVVSLCLGQETTTQPYYYKSNGWDYNTEEDKNRTLTYLEVWHIDSWETLMKSDKRDKAIERKIKRITDKMREVPRVPQDVQTWMAHDLFPEQFLFIEKEGELKHYNCTACGRSGWSLEKWKHGNVTNCPLCGESVIVNSRQKEKTQEKPVVILQSYGDQWVERQFKAICTWWKEKTIELHEELRAIIPYGASWGKVWYGTLNCADETSQEFWDHNPKNKRFVKSYLYPGNLSEVLKSCGSLEQSGLEILAKSMVKFNVNNFIISYNQRRWLEYLIKAKLTNLVADITDYANWPGPADINTCARNLSDALRLDGNRINRLKQLNGGICVLEWLRYEQNHGVKISQDTLQYLSDKNIRRRDCFSILECVVSVNRMTNYIKKQKMKTSDILTEWRDYLRMAKEEGLDTNDDIVRFPRDLKARHDEMVEIRNAQRDALRLKNEASKFAELNKKIMQRLPKMKRYFWEDDTYMIIPAGTCEELIQEGRTLHHCVGATDSYMMKMAEGTTWICFLRKKENLEEAYYTLEIRLVDDSILQWYSAFDRKPDEKIISAVLDNYKAYLKQKQQAA